VTDYNGLIQQDLIVTSFDVTHGKPAPEPYLAGMRKVGTNPWETIVVENAPLGVQAAVAAKCFTVAVNTGPLPDEALKSKGADIIMPNMSTFSRLWESLFSGNK
jgi:beta-phosphoglucomutase-like phosphatase (HAD superfamily)